MALLQVRGELMKISPAAFVLPRHTLDSSPSTHTGYPCLAQKPCFYIPASVSASPRTPGPSTQLQPPHTGVSRQGRRRLAAPSAFLGSRPPLPAAPFPPHPLSSAVTSRPPAPSAASPRSIPPLSPRERKKNPQKHNKTPPARPLPLSYIN